jgi:hypothetical protein
MSVATMQPIAESNRINASTTLRCDILTVHTSLNVFSLMNDSLKRGLVLNECARLTVFFAVVSDFSFIRGYFYFCKYK